MRRGVDHVVPAAPYVVESLLAPNLGLECCCRYRCAVSVATLALNNVVSTPFSAAANCLRASLSQRGQARQALDLESWRPAH